MGLWKITNDAKNWYNCRKQSLVYLCSISALAQLYYITVTEMQL